MTTYVETLTDAKVIADFAALGYTITAPLTLLDVNGTAVGSLPVSKNLATQDAAQDWTATADAAAGATDLLTSTIDDQGAPTVGPLYQVMDFPCSYIVGFEHTSAPGVRFEYQWTHIARGAEPTVPNNAPVANPDTSPSNTPGNPVTVDVLGNDTDSDGTLDPATVTLAGSAGPAQPVTVAGEGVWSVNAANGQVTFTPDAGFTGDPAPISYTVNDDQGATSNSGSITVQYAAPGSSNAFADPSCWNVDNSATSSNSVSGGNLNFVDADRFADVFLTAACYIPIAAGATQTDPAITTVSTDGQRYRAGVRFFDSGGAQTGASVTFFFDGSPVAGQTETGTVAIPAGAVEKRINMQFVGTSGGPVGNSVFTNYICPQS